MKERFPGNAKPPPTLSELKDQLNTLKQYDVESLKNYYERVRILLYELKINDRFNAAITLTFIENRMLSQVITRYVEGLQDFRLRYKVFTEYVDVNEHTKSLQGAYEVSEHQLRVMKAKDLRQKQQRNEDIANIMYEFMTRGMSLEAAVNATAAIFYEINTHEASMPAISMPIPNHYAKTPDSTPRISISASTFYHRQCFSPPISPLSSPPSSPPSSPDYTPY